MAGEKGLNVDVPKTLALAFKAKTAERDTTMRQAMTEILELYVAMNTDEVGSAAYGDLRTIFLSGNSDLKAEAASNLKRIRLRADSRKKAS